MLEEQLLRKILDERPDIRVYLDSERGAKVQAKKSPILSFVAMESNFWTWCKR